MEPEDAPFHITIKGNSIAPSTQAYPFGSYGAWQQSPNVMQWSTPPQGGVLVASCDDCGRHFYRHIYAQDHLLAYPAHHLTYVGQPAAPTEREISMFEQLLKLYTVSMQTGVVSPMPHFVGPPGSGKSTIFKQVADLVGVKLHTINVSRISPLELEGVQMPNKTHTQLNLLPATFWTQLKEGDILLLDEFLRGFPEVYNGLLDILTAREVAGHKLPHVFIAAASNSVVTYDKALEDRLLHIPVPDPRKKSTVDRQMRQRLIDEIGLHPSVIDSSEMDDLMKRQVHPTYELLDVFAGTRKASAGAAIEGSSLRKLIGQARLRHVTCDELKTLIDHSNNLAWSDKKPQYVVLLSGKHYPKDFAANAEAIRSSSKLSDLQRQNLEINLSLIEVEEAKSTSSS